MKHVKEFIAFHKYKFIIGLVAVAVAAGGIVMALSRENREVGFANPLSDADIVHIIEQVAKHMVLPDERPAVAIVSDPTFLPREPFFVKAQKGYQLLIYPLAQKVILFDPQADKIVEVAPLIIGQQAQ